MKIQLRKYALNKRKKLPVDLCSKLILENFFKMQEYKNSKNILAYYSIDYEVNILNCLMSNSKNWYLPRVNGNNLEVCPYVCDKLKKGSFNIPEPSTDKISNLDVIDMIIIPAVAADKNGYRIGYGKGYYDRFLNSLNFNPIKICFVFSDLLFDTIYPEQYDVKCDIVVTDKEIFRL